MSEGEGTNPELEEKAFKHDLRREPQNVQDDYYQLLSRERAELSKERGGRPPQFSVADKRELLRRAKSIRKGASLLGLKNPFKTDSRWRKAHSKEGRPPIGGAQDD